MALGEAQWATPQRPCWSDLVSAAADMNELRQFGPLRLVRYYTNKLRNALALKLCRFLEWLYKPVYIHINLKEDNPVKGFGILQGFRGRC